MPDIELIGKSEQIQNIRSLIKQVAPAEISVLITGESGTGKEVIAELIHRNSPRAAKPMITVNCSAIPEGIFESEIFGHERGSFTGADKQRKGYFELANNGAIFLDEIGEMPMNTQVKILRILESGEFMRVGGSAAIKVDVRVIAASNRDLASAVAKGEFRSDLYYRLKAVTIHLPPLRDRKEDIPLLVEHFTREFCRRSNIPAPQFTADGMEILTNHHWEGNIRELKNFVESLVTLEKGRTFDRETISRFLAPQIQPGSQLPMIMSRSPEQMERELVYRTLMDLRREVWELRMMMSEHYQRSDSLEIRPTSMDEMEREQIMRTLEQYGGNRRLTAQALGIGERTLYRKLKQYGLS